MIRTAGFEKHLDEKMESLGFSQNQYELGYENRKPIMTMTKHMDHAELRDLAMDLKPDFNAEVSGDKLVFGQVRQGLMGSKTAAEGLTNREVGRIFEIIGEMEAVTKEALLLMRRTNDRQVEDKAFRMIDQGVHNLELAAERLDAQLTDLEPGGRVASSWNMPVDTKDAHKLMDALEGIAEALDDAKSAAQKAEQMASRMGGELSRVVGGQINSYLIGHLKNFLLNENQPGSVEAMKAYLRGWIYEQEENSKQESWEEEEKRNRGEAI